MSDELVYTPVFNNIYEIVKVLPMEDGYALLMAHCAYANGEELPEMSDLVRVMFEQIAKPSIDRTLSKAKRNRENGKRHAKANQPEPSQEQEQTQPEPNQNPTQTQTQPNANPTQTQTEANQNPTQTQTEANETQPLLRLKTNDKGLMTNKTLKSGESAGGFRPPTVEEARAYGDEFCRGRGIPPGAFNAERFVAFYGSKGWRVGDHEMKSWRNAAANWILKDHPEAAGRGQRGKPDRFAAYD